MAEQLASTNQQISSTGIYLDFQTHRPFSSNAKDQTNSFDKYCNDNITNCPQISCTSNNFQELG